MQKKFIRELVSRDCFAAGLGIELIDAGNGWATTELTLCSRHADGLSDLSRGTLLATGALAFFAAANSRGRIALGIHLRLDCLNDTEEDLRPDPTKIIAEAREVSLSRRIGIYQVTITDQDDRPVALLQGTAYRKQPWENGPPVVDHAGR